MGPKQVEAIERWNYFWAGLLILVAAVFFSREIALGVTIGALLCCANFYSLTRLLRASMKVDGPKRAALQLLLVAKMGLLILLVFLSMRYLPISAPALALGLSVFLLSIGVESVRFIFSQGAPKNGSA